MHLDYFDPWGVVFFIAVSIICTSAAQIMQKKAAQHKEGQEGVLILKSASFWGALVFLGVGFATWLVVLSFWPLSIAYPVLGLNYVLVVVAAKLYFHEAVSFQRWCGIFVIILGLFFLSG